MKNLLIPGVKVKASSGTSKDSKSILDDSLESCWTGEIPSDSEKATLTFTFPQSEQDDSFSKLLTIDRIKKIDLTFQGGYSVQKVTLNVKLKNEESNNDKWERIGDVFPRDGNEKQDFDIPSLPSTISPDSSFSAIRLGLEGSTDDFGRVIIYRVALWAQED